MSWGQGACSRWHHGHKAWEYSLSTPFLEGRSCLAATSPGKGRNGRGERKTGCSPRHPKEARASPHPVRTGRDRGGRQRAWRGDTKRRGGGGKEQKRKEGENGWEGRERGRGKERETENRANAAESQAHTWTRADSHIQPACAELQGSSTRSRKYSEPYPAHTCTKHSHMDACTTHPLTDVYGNAESLQSLSPPSPHACQKRK